ncbi:MAG: YdcF family protein [Akkermansiaceae bacterium]
MTVEEAAGIIWDYHLLNQQLEPCELIWALGSVDLRVADRVAELWHAEMAPLIVMSGGLGNFTSGIFEKPEADLFAERAIALGVPEEVILIENRSTNTGENVRLTRELLESRGISVSRVIAVQKPNMERRTFATIRKQWPEVEVSVTSPQFSLEDYCNEVLPKEILIHVMVGDLQRIMEYPELGFMIEQEIPPKVRKSFDFLIERGFDGHLIRS